MPRVRLNTRDPELLEAARCAAATTTDAHYAAYDDHPLPEPDEWGDLASFRVGAGGS